MLINKIIGVILIISSLQLPMNKDMFDKVYVSMDMQMNKDVHHYILLDERFENNDSDNPDISLLTRDYIEVYSKESESSFLRSAIAIEKVNDIHEARRYIEYKKLRFIDEKVKVVISPLIIFTWVVDNYSPKEY